MRYFLPSHKGVFLLLTCFTLSVLLFFACSKQPKVNQSRENLLRTGKWKLTSGTIKVKKPNGKDTTLDYLKFIPDCYKDDYFVFDSLDYGKRYTGTNTCSAADPEYFVLHWRLKGSGNTIDLYNGLNYIYGIVDTVQPFELDTLSLSPLQYDTIIHALDTLPGYVRSFIALDTIRTLKFSGVPGGIGPTGLPRGGFDIYDADLLNIDQTTFTIHFQMHSYYRDSTKWHTASILLPIDHTLPYDPNPDSLQTIRLDTFNYSLTFTNF